MVCATPSCRKDFGRDRARIRFVADVVRPPPLPAGVSEIREIKSVNEPMPPPEEFIKTLTYWEISEMRSDA